MSGLAHRIARLERVAAPPARPMMALVFCHPDGTPRRALVASEADGWRWRDVDPRTEFGAGVDVKRYGWPMDLDDC